MREIYIGGEEERYVFEENGVVRTRRRAGGSHKVSRTARLLFIRCMDLKRVNEVLNEENKKLEKKLNASQDSLDGAEYELHDLKVEIKKLKERLENWEKPKDTCCPVSNRTKRRPSRKRSKMKELEDKYIENLLWDLDRNVRIVGGVGAVTDEGKLTDSFAEWDFEELARHLFPNGIEFKIKNRRVIEDPLREEMEC